MTADLDAADRERMARDGVMALSDEAGLALFDAADAAGDALLVPVRLDTSRLRNGSVPPMLRGLSGGPGRRTAGNTRGGGLAARLAALPTAEAAAEVVELVRRHVAIVLGLPDTESVDIDRAFNEVGFDSLIALELRNRLSGATELRLPATLVFDYPTPAELAAYLLTELLGERQAAARGPQPRCRLGRPDRDRRDGLPLPRRRVLPEDLWSLVDRGGDAIAAFPADRGWDESLSGPDPLGDVTSERADSSTTPPTSTPTSSGSRPARPWRWTPSSGCCWRRPGRRWKRAGIDPAGLRGSRTGVFAGVMYHDYGVPGAGTRRRTSPDTWAPGACGSVASGRVSYTLGLEGPAVTVDTACSSSLVALHLAVQALRSGEC